MEEKVDDLQKVRENDLSPIGLTEDLGDLYDREEKLNEELMDVPYNEGRLKDLNDQLQRVYEAESKLERVKGLEDKVSSLKEDVASKKETLSDKENEANTLSGKIDNQSSKISEMDKELSQLDGGTEEDVEELRLKVRELKGKIDKLEVKVEADKNTREEIDQLKQTREQKAERQETASLLSEAFGRHGIPSMVLEGALPQIEERANEFLSDLTSGKMKVRMDTTREKKTGGTADTLDITVLVGGTEQPYEMFSGGESFRINFAIRVALSQHLAAKTGRPIRTLMIDEGFGTQDGEGKDKVKDTIAYASKHFDRVLVITHIKQLKDAFPQRVEVTKAPGRGSVVDVIR